MSKDRVPKRSFGVAIEADVPSKMRDGTVLRDRNHNTGGEDYFESTLATARQTVYHDRQRPSRVVLPVVR